MHSYKYFLSPEFHRNLWTHFSPARLWAMPVLVGLATLCVVNMEGDNSGALMSFALGGFWLTAIVWGSHAAGAAVQDEVRNNTWDFQRISSISPMKYAFGKFFGVTSYIWYFALALWGLFAFAYVMNMQAEEARKALEPPMNAMMASLLKKDYRGDFIYTSFFMFLGAIFAQGIAFYEGCRSLTRVERWRNTARWRSNIFGFLIGLSVGTAVFSTLVVPGAASNKIFNASVYDKIPYITWHDVQYKGIAFVIASLVFLAGWVLVAIYRFMKEALQHKPWPVAWPLFAASFAVYVSGYSDSMQDKMRMCFVLTLALTYLAALRDASESSMYRRLLSAWRYDDKLRMLQNLPLWVTSFALVIFFYFGVLAGAPSAAAFAVMTSLLLFAVRDGIMLHALLWRREGRDRFMIFAFYVVAYMLLPLLHANSGLGVIMGFLQNGLAEGASGPWLVAIYYPTAYSEWHVSVLPPLIQVVLAALFLRWNIGRKV